MFLKGHLFGPAMRAAARAVQPGPNASRRAMFSIYTAYQVFQGGTRALASQEVFATFDALGRSLLADPDWVN
jgi:hypothetical protein